MKKLSGALMVLLVAPTLAFAVEMWTNSITGEVSPWPPHPGDRLSVPAEWCVENGWAQFGESQQAAWDAKVASEIESAAQYAGPEPELYAPALDEEGNVVGVARIVVRAATWEIVGLTNSASPTRKWATQLTEYKGRNTKADANRAAIRAAKSHGNGLGALADRVGALEAERGVE